MINDQAVADDASLAGMQRAGGHKPQHEFLSADDQRVSGVVSAAEADDHIGVGCQHIDDFALAFITPLHADYGNCFHFSPPTGIDFAGLLRAHLSG